MEEQAKTADIFSYFSREIICCGFSLEMPH